MSARILVFAGSLRTGAFSISTADAATKELSLQGADVTRISLADHPLPIMDEDLERESGIPANAMKLGRLVAANDGFLIASPEYNSSIPPLLKNTIDWISRIREDAGRPFRPFSGKVAALCSSSDGNFGGIRGLYHLRSVLMNCQVEVITPQCSVSRASQAFHDDGEFRDDRLKKMMTNVCATLIDRARMMRSRQGG